MAKKGTIGKPAVKAIAPVKKVAAKKVVAAKTEPAEFDLEKLHKASLTRQQNRKADKRTHLHEDFDIDVKKTYELSMELPHEDKDLQQAHLESVLSAGATRYDR